MRVRAGVAWSAITVNGFNSGPGYLFHCCDHLLYRIALTGAKIVGCSFASAAETAGGKHVRFGKIRHMDVVAHAGAVGCLVVGPVDFDMWTVLPSATSKTRDIRLIFRLVMLADFSVRICTGRVEIAQRDRFEAVGLIKIAEHTLDGELRSAVGIYWLELMILRKWGLLPRFRIQRMCSKIRSSTGRAHASLTTARDCPKRCSCNIFPDQRPIRLRKHRQRNGAPIRDHISRTAHKFDLSRRSPRSSGPHLTAHSCPLLRLS